MEGKNTTQDDSKKKKKVPKCKCKLSNGKKCKKKTYTCRPLYCL